MADSLSGFEYASEEGRFSVPKDFPIPKAGSSGHQQADGYQTVEFQGREYLPGCSPPELWMRWQDCGELVEMFLEYCLYSKESSRTHMTDTAVVALLYERTVALEWASDAEMKWIFCQVCILFDCENPLILIE